MSSSHLQVEAGAIIRNTREHRAHRVIAASSLPGRYLVRPVKYSEQYGIVRTGRDYWTTLNTTNWSE